jgi:hypothetical protein
MVVRAPEHREILHISFLIGVVTQLVLNRDFTNLAVFVVDQDGDGEIGGGGIEAKGLLRSPAYQIFESNGRSFKSSS